MKKENKDLAKVVFICYLICVTFSVGIYMITPSNASLFEIIKIALMLPAIEIGAALLFGILLNGLSKTYMVS